MRNHTFQNIPRSMVEKVSAQFEWPRDRPLDPTMDSNTAFVNAQSLMKAGMQRQDPQELLGALQEEKDEKERLVKEEKKRRRAKKKAEKVARAQAEIDRIKNEGKTEDQIEKERQERQSLRSRDSARSEGEGDESDGMSLGGDSAADGSLSSAAAGAVSIVSSMTKTSDDSSALEGVAESRPVTPGAKLLGVNSKVRRPPMGMYGMESKQGQRAALVEPAPLRVDPHEARMMTKDERGLKFKSLDTVPALVSNPQVVGGVKAASHDDFALDMYLQQLLNTTLKVAPPCLSEATPACPTPNPDPCLYIRG